MLVGRWGVRGSVVGDYLRCKLVLKKSNALRLHPTQGVAPWCALQLALPAAFVVAIGLRLPKEREIFLEVECVV